MPIVSYTVLHNPTPLTDIDSPAATAVSPQPQRPVKQASGQHDKERD